MRGLRCIVTGVLLAAAFGAAPGWAQDPPPAPLPKAEELDAQAKREIAQALRTLPFSLRAKLERLFSGDATAAAEVTEAERRLIAKLPEPVRDRILERLPETESRSDGRDNKPAGSKDTPKGQTPIEPEAGDPKARQAFAALVGQYDEDPLTMFHLGRLLSGETGAGIALDGK